MPNAYAQCQRIASIALRETPVRHALYHDTSTRRDVGLSVDPPPTLRDQRDTGLCWLYAGLALAESLWRGAGGDAFHPDLVNLYRAHLKRLVRVERALLSDASRLEEWERARVADSLVEDGGTWGMFRQLAQDGIPLLASEPTLPRSAHKSAQMRRYLRSQLRNGASLRDLDDTIDRCLGPELGDDANDRVYALPLDDLVQLVHAPDRNSGRWISVPHTTRLPSDADAGAPQDPAWCTSMDHLRSAVAACLADARPVWLTVAVDLTFDRSRQFAGAAPSGILPALPRAGKAARMRSRDLAPNHAVLVVGAAPSPSGCTEGADCSQGITHWRVLNSWGKRLDKERGVTSAVDHGDHHHVVVTDEWFREHAFHAVVFRSSCERLGVDVPPPVPESGVETLSRLDVLSVVAS